MALPFCASAQGLSSLNVESIKLDFDGRKNTVNAIPVNAGHGGHGAHGSHGSGGQDIHSKSRQPAKGSEGQKNPLEFSLMDKLEVGFKAIFGGLHQVQGNGSVLFIGPMNLPSNKGHHDVQQPRPLIAQAGEDLWVRGFRTQVVDGKGNPLPGRLIHHGIMVNPRGQMEQGCPNPPMGKAPQTFMAAGSELTPFDVPEGYGLPINAGDVLAMVGEFHNPMNESYGETYLRIDLNTVPRRAGDGIKKVIPMWMSVKDFCRPDEPLPSAEVVEYEIPPGYSEASSTGKFRFSGRIIAIMPHLHEHAVNMKLTNTTTGEVLWQFQPTQDAGGNMEALPIFSDGNGPRVKKGDSFEVSAAYDVPGSEPLTSMALMLLYIAPE